MTTAYRLLAVDVDGTLMNSRNELPEANRIALHRAHGAGVAVCLCTGRSLTEARIVIDQLGLDSDVGVFVFGAIVSELPRGRTLNRTHIPAPLVGRVVAHFQGEGYPILLLHDVEEAGWDYRFIAGRRNADAYDRWLKVSPCKCVRAVAWEPGDALPVRIGVIATPQEIEETVAGVRQAFSPSELKFNAIYAPNYGLHVVECFAPQVNKWHGINQVAGRLGVAGHQIVTIGDDVNDLEMIRQAGLGIAMGNAIDRVKALALWEAPRNDEAGVAAAVDAILGGKLDALRRKAG